MSHAAIVCIVGVDRAYLSGIERGVRNLSLLKLRDVARALSVPMHS